VIGAPELAVEAVTKRFPGTTALDDVSLDVRAGEIHAVIGENGAGKTTLLGPIVGSVVQKSYDELWLACWMLYWLNHNQLKPVPDWRAAGINPLPEQIVTGVWPLTPDNLDQFKH
jgi:ABC-type uncharacterized transport system YnjBCD ATPase subunit